MVKPKKTYSSLEDWEPLIPSKFHYFQKFSKIDDTDLNIIFKMTEKPDSPRNVRKISQELGLPQQTVNYRVQRFDKEELVRFRAITNETLLGLNNYVVVVTVKPGLVYVKEPKAPTERKPEKHEEIDAATFLTCYPVWRLVEEVHGGTVHGFCVVYSIPPEKENDLRSFLNELESIGCISKLNEFQRVTPSGFSTPSQELLQLVRKRALTQGQSMRFNWESWVDQFEEAPETTLTEEKPRSEFTFEYEDLLVLFHLEGNLRERFADIAKDTGEPSAKVARRYKEILRRRLIAGCRVEISPIDPRESVHLTIKVDFTDGTALGKFVTQLNEIPYPVTYQKIVGKNVLFLHLMVPSSEYGDFHHVFESLSRRLGVTCSFDLYMSTYFSKYDNVMLYKAFSKEEGNWSFSRNVIHKALRKKIEETKFRF